MAALAKSLAGTPVSHQQRRVCERRGRACSPSVVAKASRSRVFAAEGVLPKDALSTPYTLKAYNQNQTKGRILFHGVHHVALLCESLERSLDFYCGVLGLEINPDRPHEKLPYRGAWLWIGPEMIHLMELPNPDPLDGRPEHGGRDRHTCVGVESIEPLEARLKEAGIEYTRSMSGRPAIFFRDPDANCLEVVQIDTWR
ncbi:hypothetical protein ABPG77_009420 [Micractinium sp. CCAP 211/92]